MTAPFLDVSLVTYRPDETLLAATLDSLAHAARPVISRGRVRLVLIDNGPGDNTALLSRLSDPLKEEGITVQTLSGHGNIGYGQGHDLALMAPDGAPFHLILNPDVIMAPDALEQALSLLEQNPSIAMVAPRVDTPDERFEALCKRYPDVVTLALRGFAPAGVKRLFAKRLARYEMRDRIGPETSDLVPGIPIASGCFMMLRASMARAVGGFGSAYFLYFEDFDLCLRLHNQGDIVYAPAVRIVHHGGQTARKGLGHIRLFVASAITFFRRNGFRWRAPSQLRP